MIESDVTCRAPASLALSVKIEDRTTDRINHFHARVRRSRWDKSTVHRVYVTKDELLFVDTGLTTLEPDRAAQQAAGSLGYGFIPGLMGQIAANKTKNQADKWMKALDRATPEKISEFVNNDANCFRLAARQAYEVHVDPLGVWDLLFRGRDCKAKAHIGHPDWGTIILELLSIEDVGIVVAEFPCIFGAACQINVTWDSV